ncbi:tRNA synthetase beta subunit family protein [Artemisia annua]|uniref:tRNA synthetase beta subunit family protein n=1 Tax=Artemisia annua TaxID=35608 RepID=A0A2U1P414_ARTAN|nr:tRNA synthetase beta subunit family protein [Artemisia annua]
MDLFYPNPLPNFIAGQTVGLLVFKIRVTMYSMYCEWKFEIEPVEVIYYDEKFYIFLELCPYNMKVSLSDINRTTGLSLEAILLSHMLEYDPDLPPELAAAAGHDTPSENRNTDFYLDETKVPTDYFGKYSQLEKQYRWKLVLVNDFHPLIHDHHKFVILMLLLRKKCRSGCKKRSSLQMQEGMMSYRSNDALGNLLMMTSCRSSREKRIALRQQTSVLEQFFKKGKSSSPMLVDQSTNNASVVDISPKQEVQVPNSLDQWTMLFHKR